MKERVLGVNVVDVFFDEGEGRKIVVEVLMLLRCLFLFHRWNWTGRLRLCSLGGDVYQDFVENRF